MFSGIKQAVWGTAQRWFPDRQIYHRSEGEVRYFEVTTTLQIGALVGAAVLAGWLCFTSVSVAFHGAAISEKNEEIRVVRAEAEAVVNEALATEAAVGAMVESQREEFLGAVDTFEARQMMLARLIDFAEGLNEDDVIQSPADEDGRIVMAAAPADPSPREARDAVLIPAVAAGAPPEARMTAMQIEQDAALAEAEDAIEARNEHMRSVLRLTGLRIEDMVGEETDGEEQGGPFLAIGASMSIPEGVEIPDDFRGRIARVAARLSEAEILEGVISSAPLGQPVGVPHRRTSPYGYRRDPFTRRPAEHAGMDFAAYRRAPITATGPGRVIYAGWKPGYGRVVEIDHGYGFMTRYGHLHEIAVRRGDDVERGQQIGGMGSTGRSTATHLHYEVWFNRSHLDPARFLRAGQYVQQGQ